jgi:hypothetical protein
VAAGFAAWHARRVTDTAVPELPLRSPFSLRSALNYGVLFVGLEVLGETGRRSLGAWGSTRQPPRRTGVERIGGRVGGLPRRARSPAGISRGTQRWSRAWRASRSTR